MAAWTAGFTRSALQGATRGADAGNMARREGRDPIEGLIDPMVWLHEGLPLTLLIDMLDPAGPRSRAIFADEPADLRWLDAEGA